MLSVVLAASSPAQMSAARPVTIRACVADGGTGASVAGATGSIGTRAAENSELKGLLVLRPTLAPGVHSLLVERVGYADTSFAFLVPVEGEVSLGVMSLRQAAMRIMAPMRVRSDGMGGWITDSLTADEVEQMRVRQDALIRSGVKLREECEAALRRGGP
jgi:hypothetical protein